MTQQQNQVSDLFIVPAYSDEDIKVMVQDAMGGNIPAKLNLVLHNQKILNQKLDAVMQGQLTILSQDNAKQERKSAGNAKES